jgi:hypothetical protein
MDETEQKKPRNPNDLLIIQNIDTDDHEWQYDAVKTPLPYYLRAGETRKLPFYIAKHGVEKLIDKMLLRQNRTHTNPLFRKELRDQIVVGLEHINLVREKTPNEIMLEEMQRKKDSDPYEELLKARDIKAEQERAAKLAQVAPPAPMTQTIGVLPTVDVSTVPSPLAPANAPLATPINTIDTPVIDPDREAIYTLMSEKLHLDLTHTPTREKFDATPLDQLKQEFAAELPELNPTTTPVGEVIDPLDEALGAI